jgi:hypothetical protein
MESKTVYLTFGNIISTFDLVIAFFGIYLQYKQGAYYSLIEVNHKEVSIFVVHRQLK